ncbi:MAG: TonB family protein, partial [Acidobacteria bacterium]|nr:TonB family protein [Acidobacteriota bacterium]
AFEAVGSQSGMGSARAPGEARLQAPGRTMEETLRGAVHGGAGGISVGDEGESGIGSLGGLNAPSSPGRAGSTLELLSDPLGVDFRPYLQRVLILVRRNWLVVYPESARLGQRGKVVAQFAVARDGSVPKLVLAIESGTKALDLAAVSAISMSAPLPQLPPGFKSDRIRLQLTFLYNIK